MKALALAALVALASLAGCLGKDAPGEQIDLDQQRADELLDDRTKQDLEDLAAARPKNYTVPGTADLPSVTVFYNDSVGLETNTAVEGNRDDGGMDHGGVRRLFDVTPYVPVGQATEIRVKLWWQAAEGKSADLDIYVDVPGLKTDFHEASDDMNWNVPSKSMVVNTVGVPGATHVVGVEAHNGRTTSDIAFTMQFTFTYEKDAIGPGVPYALQVPANATGLVFESAKAGGAEHITSQFVVVGPNDELVSFQDYNDLAIPLEQVFVPTVGPGEYVVYAHAMRGGFLRIEADVPVDDPVLRLLATAEESVVVSQAPAPGLPERGWLAPAANASTPLTGGETTSFDLSAAFPLRVEAFVDSSGSAGFTGAVQARVESAKGVVHDYQRVARVDTDAGTLGYTDDRAPNSVHTFANVDRGAYSITIVNDSNSAVGYRVLTYVR